MNEALYCRSKTEQNQKAKCYDNETIENDRF